MTVRKSVAIFSGAFAMCATSFAPSFAGGMSQSDELQAWAAKSGAIVSSKMETPRSLRPTGNQRALSVYRVTVEADGDIVDVTPVSSRGDSQIRKMSKNVVEDLEALPALPASYKGRTLDVTLVLDHGATDGQYSYVNREIKSGTTAIHDLASNETGELLVVAARH